MNDTGTKHFFGFPISPRRQFRRLMGVSIVLFLAIVSFHAYLLYRIESHTLFQAVDAPAVQLPSVDGNKLDAVLDRYDAKAAARAAAETRVPPVTNPG